MSRSDDKRLDDIRDMCAKVASIVERGRPTIESDDLLWLALERAIEVAGEAATRVSDETRASFPAVAWKELIAVRVVLAHAYHRVDPDLLWGVATDDFPQVAEALGQSGSAQRDRG